eukprot:6175243-Pleurochrysis_carterae.AAC.1
MTKRQNVTEVRVGSQGKRRKRMSIALRKGSTLRQTNAYFKTLIGQSRFTQLHERDTGMCPTRSEFKIP